MARDGLRPSGWAVAALDRREGGPRNGPKSPSFSVFFPAYNDAPTLPDLIAKTFATLEAHVADFEVIPVNGGSRDRTAECSRPSAIDMHRRCGW